MSLPIKNQFTAQQRYILTEAETSSRLFQLADYVSSNYYKLTTPPKSVSHSSLKSSSSDSKNHYLFVPSLRQADSMRSVSPNASVVPQLDSIKVHSPAAHDFEHSLSTPNSVVQYPILTAPVDSACSTSSYAHPLHSSITTSSFSSHLHNKRKLDTDTSLTRPIPQRPSLVLTSSSDDEGSDTGSNGQGKASNKRKRGNLPKSATDVLKQWLKGHMSFPYPTEDEKYELVTKTSLSLCQVNNWFINARRRLLPTMKGHTPSEITTGTNHTETHLYKNHRSSIPTLHRSSTHSLDRSMH